MLNAMELMATYCLKLCHYGCKIYASGNISFLEASCGLVTNGSQTDTSLWATTRRITNLKYRNYNDLKNRSNYKVKKMLRTNAQLQTSKWQTEIKNILRAGNKKIDKKWKYLNKSWQVSQDLHSQRIQDEKPQRLSQSKLSASYTVIIYYKW